MGEYRCYYYALASGEKPVEEFISTLDAKSEDKFKFLKGLLEVKGYRLEHPHSKYLEKERMFTVKTGGRKQMKNRVVLRSVDDHLKEMAQKDPEFRKLYEVTEQKLKIVKPIIRYRIDHNLTQGQLAKKIGVTQQHISKIELGEFSSMETLEKVLRYVGFTVKLEAVPLRKETARSYYAAQ